MRAGSSRAGKQAVLALTGALVIAAGAALDCGTSAETIRAALARAIAITLDGRRAMSAASRDLANQRFSMAVVTGKWAQTYRGLITSANNEHDPAHRHGLRNVSAA